MEGEDGADASVRQREPVPGDWNKEEDDRIPEKDASDEGKGASSEEESEDAKDDDERGEEGIGSAVNDDDDDDCASEAVSNVSAVPILLVVLGVDAEP